MRTAQIDRSTNETNIHLQLNLDGRGEANIQTGCGFLDHMLTLFASHSRFDLSVNCVGDINVDDHHTVEDIGICLGSAFSCALGNKTGITRYGDITLPMDEALVLCAVDLSGRAHLSCELSFQSQKVGTFDTELVEEFWLGFVRECGCTMHILKLAGKNTHHIIEAVFKSAARSLKKAVKLDLELSGEIPSTKGML